MRVESLLILPSFLLHHLRECGDVHFHFLNPITLPHPLSSSSSSTSHSLSPRPCMNQTEPGEPWPSSSLGQTRKKILKPLRYPCRLSIKSPYNGLRHLLRRQPAPPPPPALPLQPLGLFQFELGLDALRPGQQGGLEIKRLTN